MTADAPVDACPNPHGGADAPGCVDEPCCTPVSPASRAADAAAMATTPGCKATAAAAVVSVLDEMGVTAGPGGDGAPAAKSGGKSPKGQSPLRRCRCLGLGSILGGQALAGLARPAALGPVADDLLFGQGGGRRPFVSRFLIGVLAGGLGGALGLGGGFLIVPALTSLHQTEPRLAVGTSAVAVLFVSISACGTYIARGLTSFRDSLILAVTSVATAHLGATLTRRVNSRALKRCFGAWLLVVGLLIAGRASGLMRGAAVRRRLDSPVELMSFCLLGGVTGLVKGLLGVGGGTVLVPALTLAFGFAQQEAQGCALLGTIPPSLISAITHWRQGNADRRMTGAVVCGSMVGAMMGSAVATELPETTLRLVFVICLSLIGLHYVCE